MQQQVRTVKLHHDYSIQKSSSMKAIAAHIKKARNNISQHVIAEHIPVNVRTLQRYETGKHNVPAESILDLSEIYGDNQLPYKCMSENLLWYKCMPTLEFKGFRFSLLKLLKDLERLNDSKLTMLCMLDSNVDSIESEIIMSIVRAMVASGIEVLAQQDQS